MSMSFELRACSPSTQGDVKALCMFLLTAELRELFDMKIFVDTDADIRLARR